MVLSPSSSQIGRSRRQIQSHWELHDAIAAKFTATVQPTRQTEPYTFAGTQIRICRSFGRGSSRMRTELRYYAGHTAAAPPKGGAHRRSR